MSNKLDREYGFGSLVRFALPSIVMMMFMALYQVVDGAFVSRFVGPDALSALNLAYPAICLVQALGIMLATGGSAVVARRMGEGDDQRAGEGFSLLVLAGVGVALLLSLAGLLFAGPISALLGAEGELAVLCAGYLRVILLFSPAYLLQLLFQSFFVTAGRPGLDLGLTVGAGLANVVLDYLFIVPLGMGVAGAALATAIGYCIPATAGIVFFLSRRSGLRFTRPRWDPRMLTASALNGSSEMVGNLASAVITFLFNRLMLRFLGPDGVAAVTIVLYSQFLLTALFMGFSMGVAPIISFNYGAGETARLRRVFRACILFVAAASAAVFAFSMAFGGSVVGIFSPAGSAVYALALPGFRMFAPSFLLAGLNLFASALFTALSDGRTSAILSFLRTFGFLLLGLLLLPLALEADGVWLAVPAAELLSFTVSVLYLVGKRKTYQYA